MLNFLQWNEQAKYPEGSSHPPCSGEEAWVSRFFREFNRLAADSGGFECVYHGPPASRVHGSETWDSVGLVKFSNIEYFRNTLGSDEYSLTVLEHLDAALGNWKLVLFTSPEARNEEATTSYLATTRVSGTAKVTYTCAARKKQSTTY
ncbi:hypothetical protein F1880_007667 [Penicillium rolfsii]|nr:hypothetical protein F1880_007667 [Penicillium rolfsii]